MRASGSQLAEHEQGPHSWQITQPNALTFDPKHTTSWAHLKEVARQEIIFYFEPFTNEVRYFREERVKG